MPQDLDIRCPKCGEAIPLDETLAAPVISRIRLEADMRIRKAREEADAKVLKVANQESVLAAKEVELVEKEASIQTRVNQTLALERKKIAETERQNILKELSPEMEAERARSQKLQEQLEASQRAELELRRDSDHVAEKSRKIDLEIARKVEEQRKAIHDQACKETEEAAQLKIKEAENAFSSLKSEFETKAALASTLTAELAAKDRELAEKEASVTTLVNQAIAVERTKIAEAERENVLKELSPEIEAERTRSKKLQERLETSERAELQLRQEKEALDLRAENLELEIARKVDEQRNAIREKALEDAGEANRLKLAERDKTIFDMRLKLEEAQRKATQGSQELQGEVLERDFESILRQSFPQDIIEPIKKGARGGDILQHVLGQMGRPVATIFWEIKRAQKWSEEWITKAKQDATEAKAEVALIVSEALPKDVRDFGPYEDIWCTAPSHAAMLGLAIRQGVISTSEARQAALGRETKMERLYDYMVGPEFRATVNGIAEPFRELYDELAKEKRSTLSRWKRQEKHLERVLVNVASLQGDLQGIAGSEMPEFPGFELEANTSTLLE